jgi:hypothetical protein
LLTNLTATTVAQTITSVVNIILTATTLAQTITSVINIILTATILAQAITSVVNKSDGNNPRTSDKLNAGARYVYVYMH